MRHVMNKTLGLFLTLTCILSLGFSQAFGAAPIHSAGLSDTDCSVSDCLMSVQPESEDTDAHDHSESHGCQHVCAHGLINTVEFHAAFLSIPVSVIFGSYSFSHAPPFLKGFKRPPVRG
ncbi:MAG: hypothetical protein V4736_16325 [Bdellovibrionota bacterium]